MLLYTIRLHRYYANKQTVLIYSNADYEYKSAWNIDKPKD